MAVITLDLGPELEGLLQRMSNQTGRSVDDIARVAIIEILDDWEDLSAVEEALKEGGDYRSLEDVEAALGLDRNRETRTKPAAE